MRASLDNPERGGKRISIVMGTLLFAGWIFGIGIFFLLWLYELRHEDAGVVDVGWTAGVGIVGVAAALTAPGWFARRLLVALLIGVWAFRLASYIVGDRIAGRSEDGRYRKLREYWGEHAHRNFLLFFEAQSVLIPLFALPVYVVASNPTTRFGALDLLGVLIWIVAVGGETLADRQLAAYRARPETRGRTCREGLWRYSRHPNYFFEWLHWWSYVPMAVGAPYAGLVLLGPAVMLLFLLRLTGIPATEKHALESRADYADYRRTTSAFVPWFPRG